MSLQKIVLGDYGQPIDLTFIDVDTGSAADISSYSGTIEVIFRDPTGEETTKAAGFKTDGTDGIIRYVTEQGLIVIEGTWRVRGRVQSASAVLTTEWHEFTPIS